MSNVIRILQERGLIEAISSPSLEEEAHHKSLGIYAGIDPTADSMHLGHLMMLIMLRWWQLCGHRPVIIVGGATGRIGDPKSHERPLLSDEAVDENVRALSSQIERMLPAAGEHHPVVMVNNLEWFGPMSMLTFLRDVGKHCRLGPMLAKDSVKTRLNSEEGISYTEFSYQILQAYDFLLLHRRHDVSVQCGGGDQWGNITAGIELTRKLDGETVYGVTWPLLLRSDGKKFGKSESGAIWLDPKKSSPYDLYQYLLRIPDQDIILMLQRLTFLPMEDIRVLEQQMKEPGYIPFTAQRRLAEEVVRFVHGEPELQQAKELTQLAAPGKEMSLEVSVLEDLALQIGSLQRSAEELLNCKVVDLLVESMLCSSRGEAKKLMGNGGVTLNNMKVHEIERILIPQDFIGDRYVLLSAGKRKRVIFEKVLRVNIKEGLSVEEELSKMTKCPSNARNGC